MPRQVRVNDETSPVLPPELIEHIPGKRGAVEAVVVRDIRRLWQQAGIVGTLTDATRTFGFDGKPRRRVEVGWPDLTGCGPLGFFIAAETKAVWGRLSFEQKETLGNLWALGGVVCVPRTVGFAARVLHDAYEPYRDTGDPTILRLLSITRSYL